MSDKFWWLKYKPGCVYTRNSRFRVGNYATAGVWMIYTDIRLELFFFIGLNIRLY